MKKVLEGELLSLAHRVLQMKSKDVDSLFNESRELYEKLLILKFYDSNLAKGLIQDVSVEQIELALSTKKACALSEVAAIQEGIQVSNEGCDTVEPSETCGLIVEQATKIPTPVVEEVTATQAMTYDSSFHGEVYENEQHSGDEELLALLDEHELALKETNMEDEVDYVVQLEEEEKLMVGELNEDEEEEYDDEEEAIERFVFEETNSINEPVEPNLFVVNEDKDTAVTNQEEVNTSREDDPFFGFNFGEVEFVRVEDTPSEYAKDPLDSFEKKEEIDSVVSREEDNEPVVGHNALFNSEHTPAPSSTATTKSKSLNDIYNSTIVVGLNDRIAFERYLFEGSSEDFNRVLSQLNTVSSFDEAKSFVEHLVKPEYNNWEGKDEYAERFMTIVEKRFI